MEKHICRSNRSEVENSLNLDGRVVHGRNDLHDDVDTFYVLPDDFFRADKFFISLIQSQHGFLEPVSKLPEAAQKKV